MKKIIFLSLLILASFNVHAQNTYAYVTGVSGNVVTTEVSYSLAGFVVGEKALIIQMKGASIYENNDAGYGAVTAYNEAGSYEFGTITAIGATSITLDISVNQYDVNASVQIISIPPDDGSGDYTEDGSNPPALWDGHTGGVYAVNVTGTYNLTGDIGVLHTDVAGATFGKGGGFRGGPSNLSGHYYAVGAQQWVANDLLDTEFGSFKGEGIASTYCNSGDKGPGEDLDRWSGYYSSGGWAYTFGVIGNTMNMI
ncbi:MAG: hypothetical protein HRT71_18930 [Flavobacteriales bacterium]|nr:hypothetical protein [Flavobacteriales bacterium]